MEERIYDRKIVLEDGAEFYGYSFGADREIVVELVFNTSMAGYQEILSDPSYTDQAVVMTYPLMGNYGMCDDDYETERPTVSAMIVREYCPYPSNFRCTKTLEQVMYDFNIVGVAGVDTRKLTRYIRDRGTCKALITTTELPNIACMAILRSVNLPRDAVSRVSTAAPWKSPVAHPRYHVVAVDCGMKRNIVRSLNERDCDVTVVPWNTSAGEIAALHPDGVLFSNGPGDPQDAAPVVELARQLRGKFPLFGICLGHQIIALSYGAKTYKLKFGHRGGNHPVKNLLTGKVEITSQNHSYAVDRDSLDATSLRVSHINLLDQTVEGLQCPEDRVFTVQYHPESAPGPEDSGYLFDAFIGQMEAANDA